MSEAFPVRGAMIGAGYFAQYQMDAWARLPGADIVAVADLDLDKAEAMADLADAGAAEHGTKGQRPAVYSDVEQMLDEQKPQFVDIATPPATHHELCMAAADRGIHVICQKPLAPTSIEANRLVLNMQKRNVRFMVHENWRWQPWYRRTKELLDDGAIGRVHSLSFQMRLGDGWSADAYLDRQPYFRDYHRLLLFETGVHFIDTFRYLLGEFDSVYAVTAKRNPVIVGEDAAIVTANFVSGATAVLDASRYGESDAADSRYTFGTMRLDGANGNLALDTDGQLTWTPLGGQPTVALSDPPRTGFGGDSVLALQQHFLDCLDSGQPFESEGPDYLRTIAVVDACYRSAETNSVVVTF